MTIIEFMDVYDLAGCLIYNIGTEFFKETVIITAGLCANPPCNCGTSNVDHFNVNIKFYNAKAINIARNQFNLKDCKITKAQFAPHHEMQWDVQLRLSSHDGQMLSNLSFLSDEVDIESLNLYL